MRLEHYLNEEDDMSFDDIKKIIFKDVKREYLELMKDVGFLYRGSRRKSDKPLEKLNPRQDRTPLDSDPIYHNLFDKMFLKKFGWKARSEGVFVTSHAFTADEYGKVCIFFPIGNYKFIWSPKMSDLYIGIGRLKRKYNYDFRNEKMADHLEKNFDDLGYVDDDLVSAILSHSEIMFKCNSYYLLDIEYADELKMALLKK